MGNQTTKEYEYRQLNKNRFRTLEPRESRQNYSLDLGNYKKQQKNSFQTSNNNIDFKPPSSQRSRKKSVQINNIENKISINNNKNNFEHNDFLNVDFNTLLTQNNSPINNTKQKDRILQKLSRRNEDLRKQLKSINDQLTQKLKKKKLVPKKKTINNNKNNDQENSDQEDNLEQLKQKQAKIAGLKRQLQNGYRQIDMYKRTLIQMKSREQTEISHVKVKQMENSIVQIDRLINETMKKIEGQRNVKKHQEKNLETDLNQDLIDNVQVLKREEDEIKRKIKEINKKDLARENTYKKQQAYLFEVEKKYREISGQYFPQIGKKKPNSSNPPNNSQSSNKKPSTFDKYSNPKQKNSHQELPSESKIKAVVDQLNDLRFKHQDYHKKISAQLQSKNKLLQQVQSFDIEIQKKDKIIQNLKMKLTEIKKILRPNKKNLFGYDSYQGSQLQSEYGGNMQEVQKEIQEQHQQDQFDIKHLIANIPKPVRLKPQEIERNNSIKSGQTGGQNNGQLKGGMVVTGEKSQPKVWGTILTRKEEKGKTFKAELQFDDTVQFQNSQVQPLIIGMNIWVNKNNDILALQAIYLNKQQIRYGIKSSNSADGFIVRYDLQAPDYLKNITGGYNQNGGLQYIALFSKKGKSGSFGNKRQNQENFTFGLASNERPFRFNGASIMIQSQPRICRLGIEICPE